MKKGTMMRFLACILFLVCSFCFGQTNTAISVIPNAAQSSATVNSPLQQNASFRGVLVMVNVPSYVSGTYTPHIQALDQQTGVWGDILVGTGISASGMTYLWIYPGITPILNGASSAFLPAFWRVQIIGTSTPSMTISVDALLEM